MPEAMESEGERLEAAAQDAAWGKASKNFHYCSDLQEHARAWFDDGYRAALQEGSRKVDELNQALERARERLEQYRTQIEALEGKELAPSHKVIPPAPDCDCVGNVVGTDGNYVPHDLRCSSGRGLAQRVLWCGEIDDEVEEVAGSLEEYRRWADAAEVVHEAREVLRELEERAMQRATDPEGWERRDELRHVGEMLDKAINIAEGAD